MKFRRFDEKRADFARWATEVVRSLTVVMGPTGLPDAGAAV
jgi:hypothetical protein